MNYGFFIFCSFLLSLIIIDIFVKILNFLNIPIESLIVIVIFISIIWQIVFKKIKKLDYFKLNMISGIIVSLFFIFIKYFIRIFDKYKTVIIICGIIVLIISIIDLIYYYLKKNERKNK